ncbi:NnrS family protein [Stutzerimonas xanthomarina]|uniref:NnrS family protein n=1 Tax=Stutzerimonas xanthomarina TaxID=271420 RepID=UPI003AA9340D
MAPRKSRLPFANAWFFPAAALYAALILPWSVLTMLGLVPALPGLTAPAGHAHEMLFGYALAVVAGYLLGPQPQRITLALLGCWLAARAGFLLAPDAWYAVGADLLFVAGLLWKVVPRFLGAAKKWRNQTVAPVVIGLGVTSLLANAGAGSSMRLREQALMLFAALMFFMGGRIIAPALAGHAQSEGRRLEARVQPQLEGAVLILLGIAFGSSLLPWTLLGQVAGAVLVAAGVLGAIRLLRWQPWHYRTRPDLLVLLVGYSWLSLGLVLLGVVMSGPWLPVSATLHVLTIGALGSLTFGVMVRTRLLYRFRDANAQPWIHHFAWLISAATLARVLPPLLGIEAGHWLLIAATCWSSAFIALVVTLWRTRMPPRPRSPSAV